MDPHLVAQGSSRGFAREPANRSNFRIVGGQQLLLHGPSLRDPRAVHSQVVEPRLIGELGSPGDAACRQPKRMSEPEPSRCGGKGGGVGGTPFAPITGGNGYSGATLEDLLTMMSGVRGSWSRKCAAATLSCR